MGSMRRSMARRGRAHLSMGQFDPFALHPEIEHILVDSPPCDSETTIFVATEPHSRVNVTATSRAVKKANSSGRQGLAGRVVADAV